MSSYPNVKVKHSIATRLLKVVFSLYFIVTLTVTCIHMVAEYYNARDGVFLELEMFHTTFERGLANEVWNYDEDALKSILQGILDVPIIVGVTIEDNKGTELMEMGLVLDSSGNLHASENHSPSGTIEENQIFSDLLQYKFGIVFTRSDGKQIEVGTGTFYSRNSIVFEKVRYGFLFIIANSIIKTISLWIIFLLVSRFLLSKPLSILTSATENLNLENLDQLQVDVQTKGQNELKILEIAFNSMVKKLYSAKSQLDRMNQDLEEKVEQRTHELQFSLVQVENAQEQLQHRAYELESAHREISHINQMMAVVNSTLDLDEVMSATIATLKEILEFDQIGISLVDESSQSLTFDHYYGSAVTKEQKQQLARTQLPLDQKDSLFVQIISENEPRYLAFITPETLQALTSCDRKICQINEVKGILICPLEVHKRVIGGIIFENQTVGFGLTEDDIKKVQRYVTQIATAIQNARLYNDLKNTKIQLLETEKIAAMTQTFEKFVPKQFLSRIAKEGLERIQLGQAGSESLSILFSDIRSFTTLSENMSPQELLNFLNTYLQRVNTPIHRNHGFIDKFIGDAIMALFDHPGGDEADDARDAVSAAIGMQESLNLYNQERKELGLPPVQTGIGIHCGPTVIGTVGSKDRMDSTVLGDSVNVASRLEGLTKLYNCHIIISSQVFRCLEDKDDLLWRELDFVNVKGRDTPISIFEIYNGDPESLIQKKQTISSYYHQGLAHYYSRNWEEAVKLFTRCLEIFPEDAVSRMYVQRSAMFQLNPPGDDWNGVLRLDQK